MKPGKSNCPGAWTRFVRPGVRPDLISAIRSPRTRTEASGSKASLSSAYVNAHDASIIQSRCGGCILTGVLRANAREGIAANAAAKVAPVEALLDKKRRRLKPVVAIAG